MHYYTDLHSYLHIYTAGSWAWTITDLTPRRCVLHKLQLWLSSDVDLLRSKMDLQLSKLIKSPLLELQ